MAHITPDLHSSGRLLGFWVRVNRTAPRVWVMNRESAVTVLTDNARSLCEKF